ncbi:hypothetical protein QAD02_023154 [Eretmocerus hayati]|uniref:Uncharacterized protein n=1 Tax=Eretmocerus hayati TaxID=131215 RepID=A0ACC2PZY3_9HYME|nr:hypothetical protein QAD02_023154 [Eretmocerus hayati]
MLAGYSEDAEQDLGIVDNHQGFRWSNAWVVARIDLEQSCYHGNRYWQLIQRTLSGILASSIPIEVPGPGQDPDMNVPRSTVVRSTAWVMARFDLVDSNDTKSDVLGVFQDPGQDPGMVVPRSTVVRTTAWVGSGKI